MYIILKIMTGIWSHPEEGLYVYNYKEAKLTNSLAIFYLNGTLVCPKKNDQILSGDDVDEWRFKYPNACRMLRRLHNENYTIILVCNELSVRVRRTRVSRLKSKIEAICRELDTPLILYMVTRANKYQIPKTGIIEMLHKQNPNICFKTSFYCGDNLNHTSSRDINFAKGCNLKFVNDEEFFDFYQINRIDGSIVIL